MTASAASTKSPEGPSSHPSARLNLGVPGYTFPDLYEPLRLKALHETFLERVRGADPGLAEAWDVYQQAGSRKIPAKEESDLLVKMASHVSAFVAQLFHVGPDLAGSRERHEALSPIFEFKRDFIQRRVLKKGAPNRPTAEEFPGLDADAQLLLSGPSPTSPLTLIIELALAEAVLALLEIDGLLQAGTLNPDSKPGKLWVDLRGRLLGEPRSAERFGGILNQGDGYSQISGLLHVLDRWTFARVLHPDGRRQNPRLGLAPPAPGRRPPEPGGADPPRARPARGHRGAR